MHNLGGFTLGQFKIDSLNDRFVWFRGFKDMETRTILSQNLDWRNIFKNGLNFLWQKRYYFQF
ncbi:hypothetical protein DM790_18370 [Flavobacterium collinsii]|nr:hypothetical protein [Flavobacterium collinsii]